MPNQSNDTVFSVRLSWVYGVKYSGDVYAPRHSPCSYSHLVEGCSCSPDTSDALMSRDDISPHYCAAPRSLAWSGSQVTAFRDTVVAGDESSTAVATAGKYQARSEWDS